MMRMNLREIEAFVAVGRLMSFSRAAMELGLSQPRLSAVIKGFEQRLGFALFARNSRNVSLTPAGVEAFGHAERVLAELEGLSEFVANLKHRQFGTIRIGAPLSTAQILARRQLIEQFQTARPDVNMVMVNAYSGELLDMVEAGSIDAAIAFGVWQRPGLESQRIAIAPGYLLLAQGDPLGRYDAIASEQLRGRAIAVYPRSIGALFDPLYRPFIEAGCSLVEAPEPAQSSLVAFGALNRLPTVLHLWDQDERARFPNAVRLSDAAFDSTLSLVRRTERRGGAVDLLWRLARSAVHARPEA